MISFDIEFEEDVLAKSLQDIEYLKTASRLLNAHHFQSPAHGWVWKTVRDVWTSFAERPTPKVLMARAAADFAKDEDEERSHLELVARLYRKKVESPKATLDVLAQFVRFVSVQVALEGGADALEKGEVDKAFNVLRKVTLQDLRPKAYKVSRWMEDWDERQRERKHRAEHPDEYVVVPTGLRRLDDIILGVQAGELAMVMGTTGRGKSIFLTHIGYQAIIRNFGVVHFSLEMPVRQVEARYDSRFTGVAHKKFKVFDFNAEELRLMESRVKKNRERLKNRLRILSMPLRRCNINTVRHAIDEMRMEIPVQVVIIDSGDHMQSLDKYDSKRIEQAEVYWDLKTLAEEEGLGVWTSTQAGREWEKKIATAEAASESYDKARIADMVVSLNSPESRTRSTKVVEGEAEEGVGAKVMKRSTLELFLAKYRDGEGKVRIPLDADFSRMLIQEGETES
jgi:replicative DNA helicase